MKYLEEKTSNVSILIENQFPDFVQGTNDKFLNFVSSYYESQERKYQPLDIALNLVDYYNIGYYRPNRLVESTVLVESSNLSSTATTINVESTLGFPDKNGYIQIDNEIIFYKEKTDTSFLECVRGTSALVLASIPKSNVVLTNSTAKEHLNNAVVTNIAYGYAKEFLTRIKSELAALLPEVLDESLDLANFIKNVKSFYSAKGSLNSHRILFKILFNDRKFNIKIKNRGSGAKLKINNSRGFIVDGGVEIVSGGSGYDNRTVGGKLINSPLVDIFGSGTGIVDPVTKTRPNATAVVEVDGINSSGTITSVDIVDPGESYRGPLTARVRNRVFEEDQLVKNVSGTGSGRVEYYDAFTDEIILYDVVGYFLPNEEIFTEDGEKARGFIAQSYTTPVISRNGLEILGENQNIEFPKEYTFKTSNATYAKKQIIKCRLLDGYSLPNDEMPKVVSLIQDQDKIFGVPGVTIEVDNSVPLSDRIYQFDVSTNSDIRKIFLPPSTVVTKSITGISSSTVDFVVTVDEATRFPVSNGIFSVKGREIFYKTRSVNQFFGCSYDGTDTFDLGVKDEVISVARLKQNNEWTTSTNISIGEYVFYGDNYYRANNSGITGSTPPTHTSGSEYDGTIVGNNPVSWEFIGKNRLDHTFYINFNNSLIENPKFQLLGLPGEITIENGGALHSLSNYEFAKFDSPNVDSYNFTTSEISDRLSVVLGTNYNRTRDSVLEESTNTPLEVSNIKTLPSYQSLTGFSNQYDFEDYIYVAGSGIPRWWDDIVDFNTTLSADDKKKVAFTNQKLITRWKKSGLISDTQAIGIGRKTKKLLGLNIDAIQANSYKGNTISYGQIEKFFIGDGGDYPVVYQEDITGYGYGVDFSAVPDLMLDDGTKLGSTNELVKISAEIKSIDFNSLANIWKSSLNVSNIVIGHAYKITSIGTTNFTSLGASSNPRVGEVFVATAFGSGTGTVVSSNLDNFTTKPRIEVINNNDRALLEFTSFSNINVTDSKITYTNHGLKTLDKVLYAPFEDYFINLIPGTEYFSRKVDDNTFTLHKTKSDALLNINKLNLSYYSVSNPHYNFISSYLNPPYFRKAKLELSYKNGSIDNIIVRDSGAGYINLPTIRISGGGRISGGQEWYIDIPFSFNGKRFVEASGPLVSYFNYYKDNYNELSIRTSTSEGFIGNSTLYDIAPAVSTNFGSGAKAVAYTANGVIVSVVIIEQGDGYKLPPKVVISGNGKDAVITSKITNGKVTGFDIVNGGTGYTQSPTLEIVSTELKGSLISSKLREWTFNLVRQLNKLDRIDSYGGYVYDSSDSVPSSNNPKEFKLIDYSLDFPRDLDQKQYYLLQNSDKLLAKYILEKSPPAFVSFVEATLGKTKDQFTDNEILTYFVLHSPAIMVSYDGVPVYGGEKILRERNKSLITDTTNPNYATQFTKAKSRYKLKYTEVLAGTSGAITLSTTDGTKYVTLDRSGGPSIDQYPIGSFIEDYEFVEGDDDDLDIHNGRFSITPEFPQGRYCYFATSESYDPITNALVESAAADNDSIGFNGFPYFIGDEYASEYDDYMNTVCRTNNKIPSVFTRSFEKDIAPIVQNGVTLFPGLAHNDEYPQQNDNTSKTIARTSTVSSGSVDSVIIESKGDNYRVGDRLVIDNNLTSGSGFGAIVSKVGGKEITKIERKLYNKRVIFTTNTNHGLAKNDFVYFEYTRPSSPIQINLQNNSLGVNADTDRVIEIDEVTVDDQSVNTDRFKDIKFYEINLNFKYTYRLNLPANTIFQLTYDIDKTNEFFTLEDSPTDSVVLNAVNIPNRLYLHVDNRIYQINKTRDFYGIQKIYETTSNTFTVDFAESTIGYETVNLSYTAKSFGASGPIEEISITNQGFGYKKLPTIQKIIKKGTEDEIAGDGKAVIQANSNTIGSLKKLAYSSFGRSFTANRNVNYYLNVPATAKITKNFEIYEIEVLDGGSGYDNVVTLLVNGNNNLAVLEATVSFGTITNVKVIDGGLNFESEPTITVQSTYGSGASLKAKIRRKQLYPGVKLTGNINSLLFPVGIETEVINFDSRSSTLEFDEQIGQFKDGDKIYYEGKVYGEIQSIRRSKAYAKVSSYSELDIDRSNISGNTSENLQKLTDSNYYQDWSYSISSSRDTKDWITQQSVNTHPAGFKQFGKKIIERRKFFFKNPLDVFKSSVIFSTKISRKLDLNIKLSPCGTQRLFLFDVSDFSVGQYVVGSVSGANAKITEITERTLIVENYNNIEFILGEVVVGVDSDFVFGVSDATFRTLNFWNGIFQEPDESYEVASNPISYVPHYTVDNSDEIVLYTFDDNYIKLDNQTLSENQTSFSLTLDNASYPVTSGILNELLITIGGVVQDPSNLSVLNNAIVLPQSVGVKSEVIALRHSNLRKLTLTGSGTSYTLNYTPTDDCQLLIFRTGIFQTQLLTDFTVSGNTITLSESIPAGELFGWYFDGSVTCQKIDGSTVNKNTVLKQLPCQRSKFKQFIESNAVKSPESIYEIRKETLDGTVVPVSSTRVEGFDTKFSYTSPRTSGSYVEVLDQITFNGSAISFSLKVNKQNYTPSNGEESLLVYINNTVLDHDQYSVSGNTITFNTAYSSSTKCTLLDFVSTYTSNTNGENGAIIDRLEVQQNGSRQTFNLSDRGVPKYVNNVGDIFVIKNDELQYPVQSYTDHKYRTFLGHTVNDNKITFGNAPSASDNVNLVFFNRQLVPEPTKNVVLDPFVCFDGTRTTFPITVDGIAFTPISVNHLFVIRNGVLQTPTKDYTVSGSSITFTTAPESYEDELIFSFYSYDGLNQNIPLSIANYVDGVETDFALTKDYVSTTVLNNHNLMMYRNGVYQVPGKDYSVLDGSSAPYIRFTTAPTVNDDIFMVNIRQNSFVDLTSSFVQSSSSTITYSTGSQVDNDMFFIFVNGILQVGTAYSTVYASSQYTVTFGSNVDISTDNVKIYAFTTGGTSRKELDPIVVTNTSTLSYSLADGGTPITNTNGPADIIVTVEGVVQEPGVAYTVSGSTLTFVATALYQTGITINIFQVGDNSITNPNESIDYIDDNYAKTTLTENGVVIKPTRYKLADGFQSFNPPNQDDLFIIRNGVVQNPTEDFITGNGYIEFTTNVAESEDLFIMYTHGTEELTISSSGAVSSSIHRYTLSSPVPFSDYNNIVVYADGVPRFYRRGDFTIENSDTEVHLSHTEGFTPTQVFIVKYPNVTLIDDYQYCPNGSRTLFKLLYNNQNLVPGNILEDADILVSQNGVVLNPDTEYDISPNRAIITFTTAPGANDVIFMVRMSRNELRTLTNVSGNTYSLSTAEPTEKENVVVFSNNKWNFAETGGFTWNTAGTQITLTTPHTTGELFAIKFFGVFNRLDQIHTPFNGSNTKFNLYDTEENFVPIGTVNNDNVPDETSMLVTKNGKLLEPKVDFTLDGDITSQIVFNSAPSSSDVISIRNVGMFDKLDVITGGTGTQFPLTKSGVDYYPNAHIERPRELENQLIVLKDGEVQSPLYDFYVDNNKIVFVNSVSFTKLVIFDFRGTSGDVRVNNRFNQVSVGDELTISGEENVRYVEGVESPTVLNTREIVKNGNFIVGNTYKVYKLDGNQVNVQTTDQNGDIIWKSIKVGDTFTATTTSVDGIVSALGQGSLEGNSPSGFTSTVTYSNGIVTDFAMTNGGGYYENPVVIRTKGTGTSAKAVAYVKTLIGDNIVDDSTIDIQYPGNNIYTNQTAVATMYVTTYKEQPLHKSTILKATKLSSNINATVETVPLANTRGMKSNPPSITVSSSSGAGADFKIFVSNNEIAKIEILNGGSGYDDRDLTLELIGGGGTGCVLEPVLDSSGTITDVIIRNAGVGYDTHKVILYYENSGVTKSETIEYTYVNSNNIDGCTRAVNAVSHDAKIESPDDASTYTLVYFEDHDDYL